MILLIATAAYALTVITATAGFYLAFGIPAALWTLSGGLAIATIGLMILGLAMIPDQPQQPPSMRPAGEPPRGR